MSIDYGKLKAKIEDSKITQQELADFCGIDRSTLNQKLSGKREWNYSEIVKVSEALKIKPSKISSYFFVD